MEKKGSWFIVAGYLMATVLVQGCATTITRPSRTTQPAKVRFSEFKTVELKELTIAPAYASSAANQKAARKINQIIANDMRSIFPNLSEGEAKATEKRQVLVIEPVVKEIKFIGGAARFWAGSMAGSSAVLIQVTYTDKATGEVVASPEFYRDASAFASGYGSADNRMLEEVAKDVCNYTSFNR